MSQPCNTLERYAFFERMPGLIVLIFVGFLVLIIVGAIFGNAQRQKRIAALEAWSASLGLSFEPRKNRRFEKRFAEFACFKQGNDRYAYNLAHGRYEGRRVYAFDYHYTTTSTSTDSKGRTTTRTHHHHFSAVILEPNIPLKPMLIRPEGFGDRIANFFGRNDIDFESAEFSKRFFVQAEDRRWAYDVLHARTMAFLLDQPPHVIEFEPGRVLILRNRRVMDASQFHTAIHIADQLLDGLPDYVRQQQLESLS
ncbi:hypothetical protein [Algisphaera agarilytica]|uniref:DUF3137 domain-containing protein n=1 Tax=Algisphaera agarilytica TaxID=1385975 RepID=A0A7X0H6J6_9BACT|nr:hypothetical protein [Algisphaera agarilytica]MBB6430208.1 hypothetical protein [Algisphaera agarilytica]